MFRLLCTASVIGLLGVAPALAEEAASGEAAAGTSTAAVATTEIVGRATIYRLAYFDQYSPSNALEIAQRVPGFQLDLGTVADDGTPEIRGFAGTAGNVVINGARPSSKSETLETILRRIPASRVSRVEVQPGDIYGSDYAGRSQVLNIVLSDDGGFDATLTTKLRHKYRSNVFPDMAGTALWKKGDVTINVAAGAENNGVLEEGYDTLRSIDGTLLEYRRKFNDQDDRDPYASASIAWEQGPNTSARANIRYEQSPFVLKQRNRVMPTIGEAHDDRLLFDYFDDVFEVGGDVTRPLWGGAIKFVGLATRRNRDRFEGYFGNDENGQLVGGFQQRVIAERDETIGRLSWARPELAGFSVELGAEYAYNVLDNDLTLSLIEEDGSLSPVNLPIAKARVRENRAQFFANLGRSITPTLRADVSLAYETSSLKMTGDASAERSLAFFKPGVTVDWRPKGWHVQASLKRTVAQLDFYDFVSIAELSNDRVNGGNENLLPQRAWEGRLLLEKPFLGDGVVKLEAGFDRIALLQDTILTEDGLDAPGNIGNGRRRFVSATVDAPLTPLGIKAARLKLYARRQITEVDDPISGASRGFSGFWPEWEWSAEYRHDLGKYAYGSVLSDRDGFCFYRTTETDCNRNSKPFLTGFVEYRPSPRTTITLDVENIINTHGERRRVFYTPNRSGDPQQIEYRDRNSHRAFTLTYKQQFG